MSIIRSHFTNIKGDRQEESRRTYKFENRHFMREAKSQEAQLQSVHRHGRRKDVKRPINKKMS